MCLVAVAFGSVDKQVDKGKPRTNPMEPAALESPDSMVLYESARGLTVACLVIP